MPQVAVVSIWACQLLIVNGMEDPQARAKVPASGKITIRDYGYHDWGPELVEYGLDGRRFNPSQFCLLDAEGRAVPYQFGSGSLAFVARVPKGGTATYTLQSKATGRGVESSLKAHVEGRRLVIRNEFLALEVPEPSATSFADPLEATKATPPILRWATRGGDWMGGARFVTRRRVASQAFRVVREGPAVMEVEARYTFVPTGNYVCRVRLSPGMPVAIFTEEFDFRKITKGEDFLLLELHRGWQPDTIGWVGSSGEQRMPPLVSTAYDAYVQEKRKTKLAEAPVGGVGEPPTFFMPEKGMVLLEKILPAGRWGGAKGGVQVWSGDANPPGSGSDVGLVPLSVGSWRRAMALSAWFQEKAGIVIALPLSVRWSRWSLEVTDDHSPFSTHEHDAGLVPTYGRRSWGLYTGARLAEAQARFGYIGLDRYKDWIIEVLENKALATYPGAFFSPDHIAKLRRVLDHHPDRAFLEKWYLLSGKTEDAVAHAQRVIDGLRRPYGENDFFLVGLSNYRKSQFLAFVNLAEDALACPDLPQELRQELRRRLTLYAYVLSDPDFNPRGAGVHLGNNNMPINRTLALSYFAGLLPDHPRYGYWMESVRAFAQYKYATEMAIDGVNLECPSYALYSPFRTLNITQNILRNREIYDFAPDQYHARFLRWLSHLSVPDPRFQGFRIIPGMGNSSNLIENVWGFSMAAAIDRDPAFAGWLRFMNRLGNGSSGLERGPNYHDHVNATPHALYFLPYVSENPQPMTTTFLPTYGVVFRHGFNTRHETSMLFRSGMNWGHWDTDALNVILYGKGAPLSPGTGYQYYSGPATANNAVYHNQVKIGRRDVQECFGRVDDTIRDYGFGPHADYAVACRFYPSQVFSDGQGPMRWSRHVLFLKTARAEGPDYFVMRDSFSGGETRRTWWEWLNLDTADMIRVDGVAFDMETTPADKVVPESEFPRLHGQTVEMKTKYGASTWFWFSESRDVCTRMTFTAAGETKTIVVVPGAPKQHYFYVVYPRRDGQPTPVCTGLAPGVARIETTESTDVIFVGDSPIAWDRDGVHFRGKAGAVRVFADRVSLCLNAGSGRIGYRGYILEGHGPFERVVSLRDLEPGVRTIDGVYRKRRQTVDLGRGVKVTGEGPYSAKLNDETIRIKTSGRARVLHITQPSFLVRPQYTIDGQQWMACWTDYPNNGWGTYDETWKIGLSVPAGRHLLTVKELVFPKVWTRSFTPLIKGAVKADS